MKITIDLENGDEVREYECDHILCGLVSIGKGPTGIVVNTISDNGLSYDEKCRILNAMGSELYSYYIGEMKDAIS